MDAPYEYRAEPAEEAYLAWAGRILADKGLAEAVEAAGRAGLPLHVAGSIGEPDYWAHCLDVAKQFNTKVTREPPCQRCDEGNGGDRWSTLGASPSSRCRP